MRNFILLICILLSQPLAASELLWTELESSFQFRTAHSLDVKQHTARKMQLDFEGLKETLTSTARGLGTHQRITLPTADGKFIEFQAEATQVMSPGLAARYPQIKTWKISGINNPEITGRIDIGPRGFHGLFSIADGDLIFIDPEHRHDSVQTEIYTVLSSRANHGSTNSEFVCELHGQNTDPKLNTLASRILENPSDDIRIYRLALAVTGEYTQLYGGSKAYALSGVTTTINRVNQVFERDLNVRLGLIADNDKLIFLSPSTDPYNNQDAAEMAEENIISTNSLIGSENYDIGHVFGTGRTGGLAFINSTCGYHKAGGVTGSNSPEGDAFNIDYVAHELGHQLGASHTFNGSTKNCNINSRVQDSAVEPGSGSSIMGYAGICGDDDLQKNSDAFFHSHSIAQIRNFTHKGEGTKCGVLTASLHNKPKVNAGKNYTVPAQTPFVLTGTSSDVDGDPLLHSWEQTDIGTSSDLYSDLIDNPLFRIWNPTTNKKRYFPRLSDLLNNQSAIGEMLPLTNRKLNFTLLVRDNKGGIATDSVTLDVIATGNAFAITSNKIPTRLKARQSFDLNWNVADTDKAPINCQSVDIGFIDMAENYTPVLVSSPNDGGETINLPSDIASIKNANIKVACSNNIFFAVSTTKHSIEGGIPVLSLNPPSMAKTITGQNALAYTLKISVAAREEIFIQFKATIMEEPEFHGEAVIAKGRTYTTIKIPVEQETLEAATNATQLVIKKPKNAQFENPGSEMIVKATTAANPEIIADVPEASGGGSFGFFLGLWMFLLLLARRNLMYLN